MKNLDTNFTPVQLQILGDLGQGYQTDMFFPFNAIGGGFTRAEIKAGMRDLRDRGYVEFARGLMTDDGEVAGSGYSATRAGLDIYDELEEIPPEKRTKGCYWFKLKED